MIVVLKDQRSQPIDIDYSSSKKSMGCETDVWKVVDIPVHNDLADHEWNEPNEQQIEEMTTGEYCNPDHGQQE